MKRYVTYIVFLLLASIPAIARAGLDLQSIKDNLGYTKDSVITVGSMVISLIVTLFSISIILRLITKAQPVVKRNMAFTEHKQFTASPGARYGSAYNRQKYHKANQVYADLYTHAEFVKFSARLHEREAEFLKRQKAESELTEHQQADIDAQIEQANKRIAEFENEQEDLEMQMQYLQPQQNDFELDQEGGEEIILCEHGLDINLECLYCNPENFCEHGVEIYYDCPVCLEEDFCYSSLFRAEEICCVHGIAESEYCQECAN